MEALISAAGTIFSPQIIGLMCLGTIVGIIFGAIPGLNTPIAVALLLPFSFALDTIPAVALLIAVYMGGISGGLVSAILLRIPGTAAAIATTFDGYPMCKKGLAAEALAVGTFGSFIGGLFSAFALWLIAPSLTKLAIKFGPWEYFGITFLSLCLVSVLMGDNVVKGLSSMFIGLLLSTVGMSSMDGVVKRFTFGFYQLEAGLSMVIVIIGIYAVPEILSTAGKLREDMTSANFEKKIFYLPSKKNMLSYWPCIIRSCIIGTFIGVLPGMGSSTGSMLSYAAAKKLSKHPEEFGTGTPEGVYATEVANNAVTGGALIPMLSLGVPGDSVTAIIMAALVMQGITVGPMLFTTNKGLINTLIMAVFVANILMFAFQSFGIPIFARIVQVPRYYLMPLIAVCCVIGCISVNNRIFDAYIIIVLGILGYALEKNSYPLPPLLLGFVLGSMVEQYYRRSLMYYGSFWGCMSQKGAGTILVIVGVLIPIVSFIMKRMAAKKAS